MVVSTKPSVAAGVPTDPNKAKRGVLCAFVGQAPVRVQGTVRVGDPLIPSGRGNGYAHSAFFGWGQNVQPLGTGRNYIYLIGLNHMFMYILLTATVSGPICADFRQFHQ
jgi:hypothetical protein